MNWTQITITQQIACLGKELDKTKVPHLGAVPRFKHMKWKFRDSCIIDVILVYNIRNTEEEHS